MSKKYIVTDSKGRIERTHYMPFDEKYGIGKTEAELLETGYLLDEIPEAENKPGEITEAYYTPEKGFWYEYTDAPSQENVSAAAFNQAMSLHQSVSSGIITPEQFKQITGIEYVAV